jgi:hypothetical protein
MLSILLSITFGCGIFIAFAHVLNKKFVAPTYDVIANLTAFTCAVASSIILDEFVPAGLASLSVGCWILLAIRTIRYRR